MAQHTKKAYLLLEDGTVFEGFSMGKVGTVVGEVVFNTCTASYEELLSDPTYYGQIVAQTYPLVGNRGVVDDGRESEIMSNGYIVREWCDAPEGGVSLHEYLSRRGIVGIYGIDTRRLTRALRDKGYMKGAIAESLDDTTALLREIRAYTISGAVEAVTIQSPETVSSPQAKYRVAVLDYGFPRATLEALTSRGCDLELLPANFTAEQVKSLSPDGIFLSDGPGDPDDTPVFIQNIQEMTKLRLPIFAIGLGHQMLALSVGAEIEKMAQGHRGSNQPVLLCGTEKFMVTDQNHGYAVKAETVPSNIAEICMTNLNDGSIEGLFYKAFPAVSVQFTPNGDRDSSTSWIFDRFVEMLGEATK
ncbi:MAG: carbamoyl phosphate synthase small subunit [Candidatus Fimenecus sp.]